MTEFTAYYNCVEAEREAQKKQGDSAKRGLSGTGQLSAQHINKLMQEWRQPGSRRRNLPAQPHFLQYSDYELKILYKTRK